MTPANLQLQLAWENVQKCSKNSYSWTWIVRKKYLIWPPDPRQRPANSRPRSFKLRRSVRRGRTMPFGLVWTEMLSTCEVSSVNGTPVRGRRPRYCFRFSFADGKLTVLGAWTLAVGISEFISGSFQNFLDSSIQNLCFLFFSLKTIKS